MWSSTSLIVLYIAAEMFYAAQRYTHCKHLGRPKVTCCKLQSIVHCWLQFCSAKGASTKEDLTSDRWLDMANLLRCQPLFCNIGHVMLHHWFWVLLVRFGCEKCAWRTQSWRRLGVHQRLWGSLLHLPCRVIFQVFCSAGAKLYVGSLVCMHIAMPICLATQERQDSPNTWPVLEETSKQQTSTNKRALFNWTSKPSNWERPWHNKNKWLNKTN